MPKLTVRFVERAPPIDGKRSPTLYSDGGLGLYLQVTPAGSRSWLCRTTIAGKQCWLGLGSCRDVPLSEARERAFETRKVVRAGGDPRSGSRKAGVLTLAAALESVIERNRPTWKGTGTEDQWRRELEVHILPRLGKRPVHAIEIGEVEAVLRPIWNARPSIAKRLRQRMRNAFDWSIAKQLRSDNPAGDPLDMLLGSQAAKTGHYRSLPFAKVPEAVARVCDRQATAVSLALRFSVLTACRSAEAREATWEEIDLATATWTIPEERTKMDRPLSVPLSRQAIAVLEEARALCGGDGLLFHAKGNPVGAGGPLKMLQRLGLDCVPHGFRSSFRSWAEECSGASERAMEFALGHVEGSATVAAYQRSDLLDARRALMQQWADYLVQ